MTNCKTYVIEEFFSNSPMVKAEFELHDIFKAKNSAEIHNMRNRCFQIFVGGEFSTTSTAPSESTIPHCQKQQPDNLTQHMDTNQCNPAQVSATLSTNRQSPVRKLNFFNQSVLNKTPKSATRLTNKSPNPPVATKQAPAAQQNNASHISNSTHNVQMPVISPPTDCPGASNLINRSIEHPKLADSKISCDESVNQIDVTRSPPIIEHCQETGEQREIMTRPLSPDTSNSPLQSRAQPIEDSDEAPDKNSRNGSMQVASDKWYYIDPKKQIQGPFASSIMQKWYIQGFFPDTLMIRNELSEKFTKFSDLLISGNPFVIQSKKLQKTPKLLHRNLQSNGTKINKESTVDIQKLKISSWKKVPEAQSSNAKSKSVDQVSREIDYQQQQLKYANKLRYQKEKKLTYFDRAFLKR